MNERTVTRHASAAGNSRWESSFADNAAHIEATRDLTFMAGRDVHNLGGVLNSQGDLHISAGRDVNLASAEERHSTSHADHYLNAQSQQLSSETLAGGRLDIQADRDLTAIASRIESGKDMQLIAGNDLTLASAADESHHYSKSKKTTLSRDQVTHQSSQIHAEGNIALRADNDLNIIASEVKAANDVSLMAGQDVYILSGIDESASFYSKKNKGSFGRSNSKQKENYDSTNVASVIDAGHNLTINTRITDNGGLSLNDGRDVTVIGSQLNAGNHLLVGAISSINVLSGVEEHGSYSKKTKSGFAGLSQTGKSQLQTTATQVGSELNAANDVILVAGNDLSLRASHIDAGHDIELHAGLLEATGDINLLAANNEAYSLTERYRKKIDLSASDGMVSFSSAKKSGKAAQSSTSVGSQVTAEHDTHLQAERDINIVGSGVSAGGRLLLGAGRDVQVSAANNHKATSTWQSERRTGIALSSDRNGVSAFAGNETNINNDWESQSTATASQLEAGGDLAIQSGRDISQTGSDLIAGQDIHLIAERNIILDAASEKQRQQQEKTRKRTGLTVNISHNFESTQDAIRGAGRGDNALSKVSGVLRANDSITQFVSGPTTSEHLGASRQDTTTVEDIHSYRESTLGAGRDINLQAGLDVEARATLISSQRDINVTGQNITLDVARGHYINSAEQALSKAGINGSSTSNSARVGIGGSHSIQKENGRQSTALPTQLQAGRDINLEAKQDLTLLGTQVQAQRDIQLSAGQDLSIHAVQNDSSFATQRTSGGGELGLAVGGAGMLSVYASADIGKGNLDREGINQQQAYLYAGHHLKLNSGRDTIIAGAQLEGEHVTGRIGRDLLMSSVPDTGKVSGKEFDASMTGSVGLTDGVSASGSVGVGQTTGSTDWIESQTQIIAHDALDIRTENHTQLDSALIASHTGNLKLDTNTLGFTDFEGHDKERSWYVNAGGSYTWAGDNGKSTNNEAGNDKTADKAAVVDHSQKNKEGSNSWDVSGYSREKDREQIVRATVGEGEIIVRSDAETGFNSIHDLNRDTNKAYEITKDKDETTELYVSSSSLDSASNPKMTFEQWKQGFNDYGLNSAKAFLQLGLLKDNAATEAEKNNLVAALAWAPSLLVDAMDVLNKPTVGVFPGVENHGGLVTQVPALAVGDLMLYRVKGRLKLDEYGELVIEEGKPVLDGKPMFDSFDEFKDGESAHISTNGIMNNLLEAITNALMQGGMPDGKDFILAYNPTHGLLGDLIESAFDSLFQGSIKSGTARNLDNLYQQASHSPISSLHIYGHSQGGLLTFSAIKGQDFSNIDLVTVQVSGAPIDAVKFHKEAEKAGVKDGHSFYQVNRTDEKTAFGLPKTDSVADLPGLGGNAKYSDDPIGLALGAVFSLGSLFNPEKSAHSNCNYSCASCDVTGLTKTGGKIREFVINPTLIDKEGKTRRLNE
ncbi:MAG TPA: hemagglutinin repeat-containing protein [Thiopseudomonas sp.]|nr:hemagglutinin repeat-containing protein [Thiopseudomonas sp.]